MDPFQSRILPRLVLDTISSLWVAHDSLHDEGRNQAKQAIMASRNADLTDPDAAALFLLELGHHLREIQSKLEAADRPYTARKLRRVLERISYLSPTASMASAEINDANPEITFEKRVPQS